MREQEKHRVAWKVYIDVFFKYGDLKNLVIKLIIIKEST